MRVVRQNRQHQMKAGVRRVATFHAAARLDPTHRSQVVSKCRDLLKSSKLRDTDMARTSTPASTKAKQSMKPTTKKTAVMKLRESKQKKRTRITRTYDPSAFNMFSQHSVAWMMTMIGMSGGLRFNPNPHSYMPMPRAGSEVDDHGYEWSRLSPAMQKEMVRQWKEEIVARLARPVSPITSKLRAPKPEWKIAHGSQESLYEQARFYLELIDHDEMERFDTPVTVLAKTVCNLRNYYAQTKDQTVDLIRRRYNTLSRISWSEDDIALIWDLVEGFTPSLWLQDERYLSKKRRTELQRELKEVLKRLTPGGRIKVTDMQMLLNEWDPNLDASTKALGDAMRALTGSASKSSNSVAYYFGFQLPFRDDPAFEG